MNIAFLGGGNMASALIGGLVAKGFDARSLSVVEVSPAARERLGAKYPVHTATAPDADTQRADTIVLAVKPQDMRAALASLGASVRGKLVISIAAGVRISALSRWLGGHRRIVRCMPNTPALIGAGISGLYAPPEVTAEDRKNAATVLGAVGEVVWVADEKHLDPVTAVSASGPAYVFWLIEQLAAFAESTGITREDSLRLAKHCVLGSAQLALNASETPEQLRKNVTSKGGTTEAALRVFENEQLAERFAKALAAATRRGAELGDELAKD
ncbi:MAG TPA: pyrroline-5-carboxylate reductase [Burkholderiales bacterium]|nr:pyrroline-5-carboxylate reductase [Burkholderiales bacterium]